MKINDIYLNYIELGEPNLQPLVFLHGWGQNIQMMMPVANNFVKTNRVIVIDLPGFGSSSEPTTPYHLIDYVNVLKTLFDNLNIDNPILIGHSFGGKLSLLYASMYKTKKLILLASPYKKEIQELSLKTKMLKNLKKVPLLNKLEGIAKKHIGSTDYKNASDIMRQVLVNHVNEDLTEKVKKITVPTLLIWGTNDKEVPIEQAYELEKLINDSAVITYDGCTHYAYLENLGKTISVIDSFIKE